ncbi:hypothetical protein MTO96_004726 [Rhipicephalus appendiculatus]
MSSSLSSVVSLTFFAPSRFDAALLSSLPWASVLLCCALLAMHCRWWFYTWKTLRPIPGPGTDWMPPLLLLSLYWKYRRHLYKSATSGITFFKGEHRKTKFVRIPQVVVGPEESVNKVLEKRKSAIMKKLVDESYDYKLDDELSFPAALDVAIKKHISSPSSHTMDELEKDTTSVTFAAADSTSAAMSWTLYLLGLNPDKQAKLQKELDEAFGRDGQHKITTSDLKQLPYLECCIKASLLEKHGYTVPAGTTCMINIHSLHRNKESFPDPESYIPERFLPENCKNMHPFSFIPFSSGVRVCLGQKFVMAEAKVLLAKLLSKFTVEATLPMEELVPAYEVVLKAKGGLRVWFRKRSDSLL